MTENELRARVCAQAWSWKGRREADGSHREIIDVYNRITPRPRGYTLQYTDAWCAGFVSAVAQACGLTKCIFPECGCSPMIELYRKAGRWIEDDAYLPQPADVIFYDWQDSGAGDNRGQADHVGLVYAVDGDLITVIEGNISDSVDTRTLFVDNRYIRGYGKPDYAAAASAINAHEDPEDEPPAEVVPVPGSDTPAQVRTPCTVTLPVLRSGAEGVDVIALQLLLIGRGYGCGPCGADGDFGPVTYGAVTQYQREHGLEVDGIIGPETWGKLICG
jgi:hypothetical protein